MGHLPVRHVLWVTIVHLQQQVCQQNVHLGRMQDKELLAAQTVVSELTVPMEPPLAQSAPLVDTKQLLVRQVVQIALLARNATVVQQLNVLQEPIVL